MRKFVPLLYFYAVVLLLVSCANVFQSTAVQYKDYKVNNKHPYNNSVNKSMKDEIALAAG